MVADNTLPLIKHVIATLETDSMLISLVGNRIYTYVPQNTNAAYIRVKVEQKMTHTWTEDGMSYQVRIQVFQQNTTPQDVLEARSQIVDLFSRQDAEFDGLTIMHSIITFLDYWLEDDGITWQSIVEFTCYVQ